MSDDEEPIGDAEADAATDGGMTDGEAEQESPPADESDEGDSIPAADPEDVHAEIERVASDLDGVTNPLADSDDDAEEGESVDPGPSGGESAIEEDTYAVDPERPLEEVTAESDMEATSNAEKDAASGVDDGRDDDDDDIENEDIEDAGAGESDEGSDDMVTVEAEISPVQREVWKRQADNAKLTLSEYIRRMVEAGRMSVQMELAEKMEAEQERATTSSTDEDELREQIIFLLERENVLSWDELVEKLSRNFEESVGKVVEALQDEGRVRHSGFRGGYVLREGDDD